MRDSLDECIDGMMREELERDEKMKGWRDKRIDGWMDWWMDWWKHIYIQH